MKHISISFFSVILLGACASQSNIETKLSRSYLYDNHQGLSIKNAELLQSQKNTEKTHLTLNEEQKKKFRFIPAMKLNSNQLITAKDVLSQFSDNLSLKITADDLPLADFLHQVFGEQLKVSYILGDAIKADKKPITLNLQSNISERKLFSLTEELLAEREYTLRFDDKIFYIHKNSSSSSKGNLVYGYGSNVKDVPETSSEILQMVPFSYGMQISLANTLRQLLGVKVTPDQKRNSLVIQGKRKDILRSLELIEIMDQPTLKNRQIGMFKSTFIPTKEIVLKLKELLNQEGISVGSTPNLALSIIDLDKQGELIFFANNTQIIERAVYWAKQIDKPILNAEKSYFIYQPTYSRAIDMGESLEALIGNGASSLGSSTSASSQNNKAKQSAVRSASSSDMKMVIDERSNSLIFYTAGEAYQQLYPLIQRLDVLPKQVMLEVMIAEVKLTDSFKSGVDFVLTNQGSATKTGGFNLSGGKSGLSYVLTGAQGNVSINLLQSNDNVNVLSRPSLLVRDGITAGITVGDDIPTVGEIITDPTNGSQTSIIYRKTGVELEVKPTINARGVIIMEINQKISNQSPGSDAVAGSPIIFERSIRTEVIAQSGQTVVLGGLISENQTVNDTSVPFFSSIPLVGKLFDSTNDTKDKTELVVLVTPKIIESNDEWDSIRAKFSKQLTELTFK